MVYHAEQYSNLLQDEIEAAMTLFLSCHAPFRFLHTRCIVFSIYVRKLIQIDGLLRQKKNTVVMKNRELEKGYCRKRLHVNEFKMRLTQLNTSLKIVMKLRSTLQNYMKIVTHVELALNNY